MLSFVSAWFQKGMPIIIMSSLDIYSHSNYPLTRGYSFDWNSCV